MTQTILNNSTTHGVQRAAINSNFTELYGTVFASTILISGNLTINSLNQATYAGKILEFTGAFTITLTIGLPAYFGFTALPPASGVATIASDGTVLINGSTIDVVRDATNSPVFAIIPRASASNSYVITGA